MLLLDAEAARWREASSVTFMLRQLLVRGEVCERDDPARVQPLCKAREVSTFGHRCHKHLLLHLRCLTDRPVRKLDAACRSLELEPRALHHLLDVCLHLILLEAEFRLAHLIFCEREGQPDTPVALVSLQVERYEQRHEICQKQQSANEDELKFVRRLQLE